MTRTAPFLPARSAFMTRAAPVKTPLTQLQMRCEAPKGIAAAAAPPEGFHRVRSLSPCGSDHCRCLFQRQTNPLLRSAFSGIGGPCGPCREKPPGGAGTAHLPHEHAFLFIGSVSGLFTAWIHRPPAASSCRVNPSSLHFLFMVCLGSPYALFIAFAALQVYNPNQNEGQCKR